MQEIGKNSCIQLANKDQVGEFIKKKLNEALLMVGL
jgi:hypothetical protein